MPEKITPRKNRVDQLSDKLARLIAEREWAPGEQMPSIRQLAEHYGVSVNTVQNAIVDLERRGRVERRPRQGVFVKHAPAPARAPAGDRRRLRLGVLSNIPPSDLTPGNQLSSDHGVRDHYFPHIFRGLEIAAQRAGAQLSMIPRPPEDPDPARGMLEYLDREGEGLDGILGGARENNMLSPLLAELDRRDVPWITVGQPRRRSVYNFVDADLQGGCLSLGRALVRSGVRRVLVLNMRASHPGSSQQVSRLEKVTGLFQAFIESDTPTNGINVMCCREVSETCAYETILDHLGRGGEVPEVVVAVGDYLALGAMRALRERGLGVPEDVGVVGATGLELSAYCSPSLTVVAQPLEQIGHQAGVLLMDMAREGVRRVVGRRLPCPVIFRDSLRVPEAVRRDIEADNQRDSEQVESAWGAALDGDDEACGSDRLVSLAEERIVDG